MPGLRERATQWLERRWYGDVAPGALLRALAAVFGSVARRRRAAFLSGRRLSAKVGAPVIVVGNLAVGGAGKTPLTIALVQALAARGLRPGVISRGYGRRSAGVRQVRPGDDPSLCGDEPLLIARRTGVPVAVAERRVEAAWRLLDGGQVDVLIADDGLQHYGLARDVEILVIDGRRRFGNGRLLPAGPLREPPERAADCDFVVVNGGAVESGEIPMCLTMRAVWPLSGGDERALSDFSGTPVHAVAGIADPARFFDALRAQGLELSPHAFPDHHVFTPDDLDFPDQAPVLMTEKDAVKCLGFARANWYAVPVAAQLPDRFFEAVAARIAPEPGVSG